MKNINDQLSNLIWKRYRYQFRGVKTLSVTWSQASSTRHLLETMPSSIQFYLITSSLKRMVPLVAIFLTIISISIYIQINKLIDLELASKQDKMISDVKINLMKKQIDKLLENKEETVIRANLLQSFDNVWIWICLYYNFHVREPVKKNVENSTFGGGCPARAFSTFKKKIHFKPF